MRYPYLNKMYQSEDGRKFRIVGARPNQGLCALSDVTDLDKPGKSYIKAPLVRDIADINELIRSRQWKPCQLNFPRVKSLPEANLPQGWRRIKEYRKAILKPIVDTPTYMDMYVFGEERGHLVRRACKEFQLPGTPPPSEKHIRHAVNTFIAYGSSDYGLIPEYQNVGKKYSYLETTAEAMEAAIKSGKKFRRWSQEEEKKLRNLVKAEFSEPLAYTLNDIYNTYVQKCVKQDIECREIDGVSEIRWVDPSIPQLNKKTFRYHLLKIDSKFKKALWKKNRKDRLKDDRSTLGQSKHGVHYPSQRYEFDSTTADIYLRSSFASGKLISAGKPTVYLVIDVFTGMIVGFHVTLASPSYMHQAEALCNAMTNKVDLCNEYGIKIGENDWPCQHPCNEISGDRGSENSRINLESIIKSELSIDTAIVAAAYRGDLKGLVERAIGRMMEMTQKQSGAVLKKQGKGSTHASHKARFTLRDFCQALILEILHVNRTTLRFENLDEEQATRIAKPSALELWRTEFDPVVTGNEIVPMDTLRFCLLREEQAKITESGIKWKGILWSNPDLEAKGLFEEAAISGRKPINIRVLDHRSNYAWTKYVDPDTDEERIYTLELTDKSRRLKNQSLYEAIHQLETERLLTQYHEYHTTLPSRIATNEQHDLIRSRALEAARGLEQAEGQIGIQSDIAEIQMIEVLKDVYTIINKTYRAIEGALTNTADDDVDPESDFRGLAAAIHINCHKQLYGEMHK